MEKVSIYCFENVFSDGQKVATWDVKNQWKPARDVDFTGGYPSFFEGVLKKLSYAEITIESVGILMFGLSFCVFCNLIFFFDRSTRTTKHQWQISITTQPVRVFMIVPTTNISLKPPMSPNSITILNSSNERTYNSHTQNFKCM